MKPVLFLFLLGLASLCSAQDPQPKPLNATAAVLRAFDSHDIVMFGEAHGCKQEYEWLDELVGTPEFADRMDDIVVEFGNSLYQELVDGYVAGDDVPSPFTVAPMRFDLRAFSMENTTHVPAWVRVLHGMVADFRKAASGSISLVSIYGIDATTGPDATEIRSGRHRIR